MLTQFFGTAHATLILAGRFKVFQEKMPQLAERAYKKKDINLPSLLEEVDVLLFERCYAPSGIFFNICFARPASNNVSHALKKLLVSIRKSHVIINDSISKTPASERAGFARVIESVEFAADSQMP